MDTSRGAHVRALHCALLELEELVPPRRKAIVKATRLALVSAYPFELSVTDSDIEQMLAEEDGVPTED